MFRVRHIALFVLLVCWLSVPLAVDAVETVRIGVLAKRGEAQTFNRWQPTADYLSREIPGHNFVLKPLDFVEVNKSVSEGNVDFILANSAIYVELESRYGASRIATLRNRNGHRGYTRFGGVIFTRANNAEIKTIEDLDGKRFAAVKENSFGGYMMAWREMQAQGIMPDKDTELVFSGTHDAVVYSVLRGVADAGTVRTDTLERMQVEGKIDLAQLKIINPQQHENFGYHCSTRLYPEWPFAKLKHTSGDLGDDVATALLRMPPDSDAARAGLVDGWTVPGNYQLVHELMRELRIGPYAELGHITFADLLRNYWHWLMLTFLALMVFASASAYLTRLNLRLRQAEGELIGARDNLAEKVRERTTELEDSHRRLERISRDWNDAFDAISDPIFIHDSDMRIVQANPAYCERAGHSLEEMEGQPYYNFFPKLDGPIRTCSDFPEQLHSEGSELQLESGEVFVSRSFGIRRADDSIRHALHILEDVTAIRRAESRRRILSRAVEQAGEGVLILDHDRHLLYCNPGMSRLLGWQHTDEYCLSDIDGVEELVLPHFVEPLSQLFADAHSETSVSAEMELLRGDGSSRPVFVTVSCIYDEEKDDGSGYVMTVFDLGEVKKAEEALTYRIGFESVVARIASSLVNVDPAYIDRAINEALQLLGEFANTDRAYLFAYDATDDTISNTHEWCAEDSKPQRHNLQQLPLTSMPWLREKLLAKEVVRVADVGDLPEDAWAEREEFQREDIRSLLLVPLDYGSELAGFIGFDNVRSQRDWAKEDAGLLHTAGEIIINGQGRSMALEKMRQSEESLAAAQHIAHMGNWDWNIVTGDLAWSDEIYRIFGLTPQEFGATYEAFLESVHPEDRAYVTGEVEKAVSDEQEYAIYHRIVRPDASIRTVHEVGEVFFGEDGQPLRMIGTVQDVTELRHAEQEMQRLNRALRTLSLCNTTLVHAEQEQELVNEVCHILVEHGGYRFAWVGYSGHDGKQTLWPVAHAGSGSDHLQKLEMSLSEDNPAGQAMRHARAVVVHDIHIGRDDEFAQWRMVAQEAGYSSAIALPLLAQGELLGVVCIYSTEAHAFESSEISLLEEMAGDLSFGIRTLRNRIEQARAEQALQQTEERYEELYENAPNAYVSVAAKDGRLIQFNRALCEMLGYSREALAGMTVFDLYADNDDGLAKAKEIFAGFQEGRGVRDMELQMRHANGHAVWVSVSIDPVLDDYGRVQESRSMAIDISARKNAEEERGHFAEQLQRSLLQAIRAIALTIEKRDPYTAGHQERVAELAVRIGGELGLDESELEGVKLGALIHDIGKISIPAEILSRPGKLEPEMYNIIKTHPHSGYEIIRGIEFPWPLAEMVLQHHERMDGSGYPQGLKSEEILLSARILMVADVVEAMASHRPYRAALGLELALEEITKNRGKLYDEQVVDACNKIFADPETMATWLESVQAH